MLLQVILKGYAQANKKPRSNNRLKEVEEVNETRAGAYLNSPLSNEPFHLFHCHRWGEHDLHRCLPHTLTACMIHSTVISPTMITSFQRELREISVGI